MQAYGTTGSKRLLAELERSIRLRGSAGKGTVISVAGGKGKRSRVTEIVITEFDTNVHDEQTRESSIPYEDKQARSSLTVGYEGRKFKCKAEKGKYHQNE
eukprot:TRINITY_DN4275_c0_g1_i25.p2 TRINITY_DN4275_c0_g1~~TRINITY_DN4275_c0_g1_i25.p2  ORF type:complete len:100 (+),score=10.62 TRINITY_DN4275_c0_g1_i25:140-439(+)